jgi:hypothetical protein
MLTAESPTIGADQAETIARAMAFPMDPIVARYMEEQRLPADVAREHERELKRYLTLCALDADGAYGMNGPVDELWHTFITFTRDYARFCDEVAGRFIHHVPTTPGAGHDADGGASYQRTLDAYAATFGEEAPPEVWPRLGSADHAGSACGTAGPAGSSCSNGS